MMNDNAQSRGCRTAKGRSDKHDFKRARRLTDVMSRIRIDLTFLLNEPGNRSLRAALKYCPKCRRTPTCDRWITEKDEGIDNEPPPFCPALRILSVPVIVGVDGSAALRLEN